jgi:hypothetical protein
VHGACCCIWSSALGAVALLDVIVCATADPLIPSHTLPYPLLPYHRHVQQAPLCVCGPVGGGLLGMQRFPNLSHLSQSPHPLYCSVVCAVWREQSCFTAGVSLRGAKSAHAAGHPPHRHNAADTKVPSHDRQTHRNCFVLLRMSSYVIAWHRMTHIRVFLFTISHIAYPIISYHISIVDKSGMTEGQVAVLSQHTTTAITVNEMEGRLVDDVRQYLVKLAPPSYPYLHNDLHLRSGPPGESQYMCVCVSVGVCVYGASI